MKFEEFDRLARGNRSSLLMAVELLLENGRKFIQAIEKAEFAAAMKTDVGNFITDDVLAEIADITQKLARLRTCKLLEYVKRSGLEFEKPNAQKPGICPVCGSQVEYIQRVVLDDGQFAMWHCPECSAFGKEGYNRVFDKHYDVFDGDGEPFPVPAQ